MTGALMRLLEHIIGAVPNDGNRSTPSAPQCTHAAMASTWVSGGVHGVHSGQLSAIGRLPSASASLAVPLLPYATLVVVSSARKAHKPCRCPEGVHLCRYYITGGNKSTALGAGHRPGSSDAPSAGARGLVGPGGLIGFDPLLEESGLGMAAPPARQEEAQLPGQGLSQVGILPNPTIATLCFANLCRPLGCRSV